MKHIPFNEHQSCPLDRSRGLDRLNPRTGHHEAHTTQQQVFRTT